MAKGADIPDDQRGIQHHARDEHGQDQTRDQTEDGVGPGEGHHGQTDVLGEEQSGGLPPQLARAFPSIQKLRSTFCQLHVRYLMVFSDSISIWRPMLSVVEEASIEVTWW